MYRIEFSPNTAKWVIALQKWGFLWVCIEGKEFDNYDAANAYVIEVGLNKIYRNYHNSYTANVMAGGAPQGYIVHQREVV